MTFPIGLSNRHLEMWSLRRGGQTLSKIAGKLGVSRQAVSQALMGVEEKIEKTLLGAASASRIKVEHIDATKGILKGYSHEMNDDVVVTFSPSNGVQVWHYYEGRCDTCQLYNECMKLIQKEAEERGIPLDKEILKEKPAVIARKVFGQILNEEFD